MWMRLYCDGQLAAIGKVRDEVIDAHASDQRLRLTFREPVVGLELERTIPATRWDFELIPDYMDLPGTE